MYIDVHIALERYIAESIRRDMDTYEVDINTAFYDTMSKLWLGVQKELRKEFKDAEKSKKDLEERSRHHQPEEEGHKKSGLKYERRRNAATNRGDWKKS